MTITPETSPLIPSGPLEAGFVLPPRPQPRVTATRIALFVLCLALAICCALAKGDYYNSLAFKLWWLNARGATVFNLGELEPGDWIIACDSHGYDQAPKVNGRFYPVVGWPSEESWGLLFIFKDGSYKAETGSVGSSGIMPSLAKKCVTRNEAVF